MFFFDVHICVLIVFCILYCTKLEKWGGGSRCRCISALFFFFWPPSHTIPSYHSSNIRLGTTLKDDL